MGTQLAMCLSLQLGRVGPVGQAMSMVLRCLDASFLNRRNTDPTAPIEGTSSQTS